MTPRQRSEMDRLVRRVKILEKRNRELSRGYPKGSMDRLIWLLLEIEDNCPRPGVRGNVRVSYSDARLLRPIVEALVGPLKGPLSASLQDAKP